MPAQSNDPFLSNIVRSLLCRVRGLGSRCRVCSAVAWRRRLDSTNNAPGRTGLLYPITVIESGRPSGSGSFQIGPSHCASGPTIYVRIAVDRLLYTGLDKWSTVANVI